MKKYVISRIIMCIEFIIILTTIFLINKESILLTTTTVAVNTNLNKTIDKSVIEKSQYDLYKDGFYSSMYSFTGELTGYVGNCPLCTGYLACPPRTNVIKEGILYNDKDYGTVRIVASSRNYPCGTILKFNVDKLSDEPIIAIVLDRGVGGNVIDLLSEDTNYAIKKVGRVRNLEFNVLREGWNK